jgi:hypothetical protein
MCMSPVYCEAFYLLLRSVGLSRSNWSIGICTAAGRAALTLSPIALASPTTTTLVWAGSRTALEKAWTSAALTASTLPV